MGTGMNTAALNNEEIKTKINTVIIEIHFVTCTLNLLYNLLYVEGRKGVLVINMTWENILRLSINLFLKCVTIWYHGTWIFT